MDQRKAHSNNKTGFLGVRPVGEGFQAAIKINKKIRSLGVYATPELAYEAYLKAKRELHPGNML